MVRKLGATIGKHFLDNKNCNYLRVVRCSFCVDAPLAHQNEIQNSTYIVPALWQVMKDYIHSYIYKGNYVRGIR